MRVRDRVAVQMCQWGLRMMSPALRGDVERELLPPLRFEDLVEPCHCGEPVDASDLRNRGMCTRCDDVRCDAYPGECGQ